MFTALVLAATVGADPAPVKQYTVRNCCYVVVNKTACVCGPGCKCAPGVCPACPTAAPEVLTTSSGRLIQRTASGVYVYVDEPPAVVYAAPVRQTFATPAFAAPAPYSSCVGGQCGVPQRR